ncbi:cobalt ECF transporter T component CbiQ [Halosimplex litoreum]|uniref:Cobalt ECF transporter T component CbiQ n=1 Tax=Halosimplex litoreum TaxID=1198301 RepID=A0A7T3KWZ9_9EURY|nr:cobalt ECF transporter T component CbiQ [Halosimplex litoreum]QPV64455.1 cobalt ECF transporter T component CbiQ [Halosimplex litoreum]
MGRTDLLDRTLAGLSERARWFLLAEEAPDRAGFLQAVAPSVKLVGLVALVALTVTQRDLPTVAALAALAGALAVASRVPARTFLGRVAGPPAFALVAVAPQALLMDGPAFAGTPLSAAGVAYVAVFTARVGVCVAFLSLLLLTTRFSDLLGGLARLRAPPIAVSLLAITYRYLLLFFSELERMARARRGRTVAEPDLRRTWRDSGNFLGTFLLRSVERGERVERAARARGGGGGPKPTVGRTTLGRADATFALVVLAAVVGVGLA